VLIYDPLKGDKIAQRLSLQGNPSEKQDFFIEPKTNEVYDFIRFARTSGGRKVSRVLTNAATDKDGNPSETLLKARQEHLENWRTLQERRGLFGSYFA
jgi:pyruvate ferredoxin oxidoreductase beta subunit